MQVQVGNMQQQAAIRAVPVPGRIRHPPKTTVPAPATPACHYRPTHWRRHLPTAL